ncbi:MAG: HAD family hydrolase [Alphaproteobacteria bacterium]|nr:HAD family hydrolase [Alphaproteobacteria bacterium]NCQ89021.1 HAD family hydrolase [Alphaproteobacteria bacterium]NCT07922.1 HAD family hydrolase [Alphaproteobacteria bacterium]
MNAHKKLAVFNWNGTLFDDMEATHIATNACLNFFNIPDITLEQEQELFTFPLIHFYEKMGVSVDHYLKHAEEVGELFHNVYNTHKENCHLADGAITLLDWLKNQGVVCKILSNHVQTTLENDIDRFDIAHYFDTISGNINPATIITGMNKFERLDMFLNENGFNRDNTFIIGDSHEEPELARKMDILGISISGGLLSPARLEKYKKDYIIDSLTEVAPILEKEWGLAMPQNQLAQRETVR